jgi:hypothetical protein
MAGKFVVSFVNANGKAVELMTVPVRPAEKREAKPGNSTVTFAYGKQRLYFEGKLAYVQLTGGHYIEKESAAIPRIG